MFLHTSLMVRGVTSVLTCYLTTFGQPLLSTEFVVFFISPVLLTFFIFLLFLHIFNAKLFSEDFGYYLSHWYHLSLSVSIIYHKVFHISISFLYKFTYMVFMQKGELPSYPLKTIDIADSDLI